MYKPINIAVPATSANLGPGFDCIGVALNLYNQFRFTPADNTVITVEGVEASRLTSEKDSLLYKSLLRFYEYLGKTPPPLKIEIVLGVPLARGLGSSATAIVGGLVAGNYLEGEPLSREEVMNLAIELEGHPDNVVPALLGNCQLSVSDGKTWHISPIPWHQAIIPVVAIPDFELSTQEARAVLPSQYSRADAIFNIAHLGLLIRGLADNQKDWLSTAMGDKLHQPYRESLIHGYTSVKESAMVAGAYGLVISGAGPTLLALTDVDCAPQVQAAITQVWQEMGVKPQVLSMRLDTQGARQL